MSEWNASSAKLDVWRFAREGGFLEGRVPLAALTRLADLLAGEAGTVAFRLEGARGERGQARLRLVVSGTLPLVCQRCLAPLPEILAIDSLLELVAAEAAEGEPSQEELEDDSLDFLPVPSDGRMALIDLIEDEILLALPVVPRHADCSPPVSAAAQTPPHPFAALSLLKRR
ncbi:MAG: YceD family protein [Zoogloeaceae bacterium]|nr:YceD family protein [Zoogloeaceae bacterium]